MNSFVPAGERLRMLVESWPPGAVIFCWFCPFCAAVSDLPASQRRQSASVRCVHAVSPSQGDSQVPAVPECCQTLLLLVLTLLCCCFRLTCIPTMAERLCAQCCTLHSSTHVCAYVQEFFQGVYQEGKLLSVRDAHFQVDSQTVKNREHEDGQKPPTQRALVSGQPAGSSRLPSGGQVWERTENSSSRVFFPPCSRLCLQI
uniref:uncharacterized protein LOC118548397 n=1 Tax=Halichoerus grypus TaxID=9711 RepID=UPI00165A0044|nr:uncharacterized protein LOC118548397 [Halichoerus grypus]